LSRRSRWQSTSRTKAQADAAPRNRPRNAPYSGATIRLWSVHFHSSICPLLTFVTTVQEIELCLATLDPESLELIDDSASHAGHPGARSGGGHYGLTIVSRHFAGRSRLERHRLVYPALAPLMQAKIHALALHTLAPDEI